MVRHRKGTIDTVDEAEAAYGGPRPMAKAFKLSVRSGGNGITMWKTRGVPKSQEIGLYLGLQARGFKPSPKLFGVVKWSDIPGVGAVAKPKRKVHTRRQA